DIPVLPREHLASALTVLMRPSPWRDGPARPCYWRPPVTKLHALFFGPFAIAALTVALVACGDADEAPEPTSTPETTTATGGATPDETAAPTEDATPTATETPSTTPDSQAAQALAATPLYVLYEASEGDRL